MAPAADREGYWGLPTSTLDWCEENYEVTRYIAEFCECGLRQGARERGRRAEGRRRGEKAQGEPGGEGRHQAWRGAGGRAGRPGARPAAGAVGSPRQT
jgi:hypothetical protein